ncbi:MAG TPA: hypothetical protein PK280_21010 [Planctomycetota bacterium]|nr:hypothetical protein [Planctomycetota bacterium]
MAEDKEQEKLVEAVYAYAAELAGQGKSRRQIQQALTEKGLDAAAAETVAGNIMQAKATESRKAGVRNLIVGGLWCGGGTLVTILTFAMASGGGGGTYVVAWGAILFGGIQMIRGLFQMMAG